MLQVGATEEEEEEEEEEGKKTFYLAHIALLYSDSAAYYIMFTARAQHVTDG
jgi:hypothetical protein